MPPLSASAATRDPEHGPLFDVVGMYKTVPGFIEDEDRNYHQRERIHKSRQNSGAMITVRLDAVSGLGLHVDADRSQHQRERVGEIVACVGNQRQAAGSETGDGFDDDEQNRREKRPFQNARRPVMMWWCANLSLCLYLTSQNLVTSVKWKFLTFMAGTTMSKASSPEARTEGESDSTLFSSSMIP